MLKKKVLEENWDLLDSLNMLIKLNYSVSFCLSSGLSRLNRLIIFFLLVVVFFFSRQKKKDNSLAPVEQKHMIDAAKFELGKVDDEIIQQRMMTRFNEIDHE